LTEVPWKRRAAKGNKLTRDRLFDIIARLLEEKLKDSAASFALLTRRSADLPNAIRKARNVPRGGDGWVDMDVRIDDADIELLQSVLLRWCALRV